MAKKKPRVTAGFVFYNVEYDDGTLKSNRKVPAELLDGFDPEDAVRAAIEEQDRAIAVMSGRLPGRIKTITRVKDR